MNLLTPPSSSHRSDKDKENKFPEPVAGPSTRSVVWAAQNSIHCLGTPPKSTTISSRNRPGATKSILKKSSQNNTIQLNNPAPQKRATTPEPLDPLVDLNYLNHPVEKILENGNSNTSESLHQAIEGYNILAARLRSSVSDNTDADASWPLFQPLRKKNQEFVDAVVRDLGRALVDPLSLYASNDDELLAGTTKFTLPSPQKSPMKKRDGMTAEQAKYARDLCVISHSVIRLLSVILSIPAIHSLFNDKQLGQILTAILAIPLADELPTPNARKTCALAIWLIQVQRLPVTVLQPAADRIAYALRRGMDGELGKEGKKGSASDGLKAIHDLCVYLPAIFTPAFTPLLPSVLSNLLATTLSLRSQACHALGGFVIGATSIPHSPLHTQIANIVTAYITTVSSPNAKSPSKAAEAAIVRTLRTTIGAMDPQLAAQGPVWAISVLASFVVLLGSRLCTDARVNRIISSLLGLGMRHKKSSVRALCCVAWRTITWSYFQPPLLPLESEDEGEEEQEDLVMLKQAKKVHCKVMMSVVELQAGISTIAAFLGQENMDPKHEDEPLRLSLQILDSMTTKGGPTCIDAMDAIQHMTSITKTDQEDVEPWDPKLLLPKGLFSANPGLLTAEFKNLCPTVRPIFDQVAQTQDIRILSREELAKSWVFDGLLNSWNTALYHLEMFDETAVPANVIEIWSNLIKARVSLLQENGDEYGISEFAANTVRYLVTIVQDSQLDLRPNKSDLLNEIANGNTPDSDDTVPDFGVATWTSGELRLKVVGRLWAVMLATVPHKLLEKAGDVFIEALQVSQMTLVPENARMLPTASSNCFEDEDESGDRARNAWLGMCLEVLSVCDLNTFKAFWCVETEEHVRCSKWVWNRDFTHAVWRKSVERWMEMEGHWEAGVVLLGLPFSERHAWNLLGEDFDAWSDLLTYTTAQAVDNGSDMISVLDKVAKFIQIFHNPTVNGTSLIRLADTLFSNLEASELREVPSNVFSLTCSIMCGTYPPPANELAMSMWLVRSIMAFIEKCPSVLVLDVLKLLDEGLCLWLADKEKRWTEDELSYDIIPLYQYILLSMRTISEDPTTLKSLENILDSVFVSRSPVPSPFIEAFIDYWKVSYGRRASPEDDWSDTIKHCLRSVGLLAPAPSSTPSMDMEVDPTPSSSAFTLDSAFVAVSYPSSSPFSTPPSVATIPSSPQRPHKVFADFPIVPTTPVSPLRRRSSNSGISRTPLSAIQVPVSPSKRRRLTSSLDDDECKEEKENLLGANNMITSVMDRIVEAGAKKKRRYDDGEEGPAAPQVQSANKKLKGKMKPKSKNVLKQVRLPSPASSAASVSSNESEDERRWVEKTLTTGMIPFPTAPAVASVDVMDEEKVGLVEEARRQRGNDTVVTRAPVVYGSSSSPRQSADGPAERVVSRSLDSQPTSRKIDLSKICLRRVTSNPETLFSNASRNLKRKRRESDTGGSATVSPGNDDIEIDQDLYDLRNTTPIPALSIQPRAIRHFKKARSFPCPSSSDSNSYYAGNPSSPEAEANRNSMMESSDDDPRFGQVTPHRLISPAMLRRPEVQAQISKSSMSILKELFGDSPDSDSAMASSDDSVSSMMEAESPTKELVARQLQRTGSRTYTYPAVENLVN